MFRRKESSGAGQKREVGPGATTKSDSETQDWRTRHRRRKERRGHSAFSLNNNIELKQTNKLSVKVI